MEWERKQLYTVLVLAINLAGSMNDIILSFFVKLIFSLSTIPYLQSIYNEALQWQVIKISTPLAPLPLTAPNHSLPPTIIVQPEPCDALCT